MSRKVNYILLVVAAFSLAGIGLYVVIRTKLNSEESPPRPRNPVSEKLSQVVEKAKEGDRKELHQMIEAVQRGESMYALKELLPDYITFLKDKDGQVQLLGAQGLHALKDTNSADALKGYLKSKDFENLEKLASDRKLDVQQYMWQLYATSEAVTTLGKLGDKSAIPLLESIREKANLGLEWNTNPAEKALAELGSVKSLSDIPENADQRKIWNAAGAVGRIKDPNKVADLMATAKNPNSAIAIRNAAMGALAAINLPGLENFLIEIMNDSSCDKRLRISSAVAVGRTKREAAEKALLAHVNNRESDIRPYAFIGLVLYNSENYLDSWFEKIMNPNEDLVFRQKLAGAEMHIPRQLLRDRRQQLYNCLGAADKYGRPIDGIRITIWNMINEIYGEEPSIVLTSRSTERIGALRGRIELRIMRANPQIDRKELTTQVDEAIDHIVSVYETSSNEEK